MSRKSAVFNKNFLSHFLIKGRRHFKKLLNFQYAVLFILAFRKIFPYEIEPVMKLGRD